MLRAILIPLSYMIGIIISGIAKDEILIRKEWFKNWAYLTALIPLTLAFDSNICIITICAINYLKSSNDYLIKAKFWRIIAENLLFLAAGIMVSFL
jgi:hypothetical protein